MPLAALDNFSEGEERPLLLRRYLVIEVARLSVIVLMLWPLLYIHDKEEIGRCCCFVKRPEGTTGASGRFECAVVERLC